MRDDRFTDKQNNFLLELTVNEILSANFLTEDGNGS
jgi:hypothetical protein